MGDMGLADLVSVRSRPVLAKLPRGFRTPEKISNLNVYVKHT